MAASTSGSEMETWVELPQTEEPELEAHLAPSCGFWWVDPEELAGGELMESNADDAHLSDTERSDTHG
ncbi:MAG: hypothetical protein WD770_01390 [Actinomycetota bacterium]